MKIMKNSINLQTGLTANLKFRIQNLNPLLS